MLRELVSERGRPPRGTALFRFARCKEQHAARASEHAWDVVARNSAVAGPLGASGNMLRELPSRQRQLHRQLLERGGQALQATFYLVEEFLGVQPQAQER